jgi:hypothetical protein
MNFNEAIKYVPRTNSFKMGDAVKRLTSKKADTLIRPDKIGVDRMVDPKKKKLQKKRDTIADTNQRMYRRETR